MFAKSFLTTIISLMPIVFVSAAIINIPEDYPTIQQGIDAGSGGDTVLVQPGTYVENINFNGHNIVLGSLFLTTGDTAYTSQTIIDGDTVASVVTFNNGEDSTAIITGFTCRNGLGLTEQAAGGITCLNGSNPAIVNNIICDNKTQYMGGGILCIDSRPVICNNIIINNAAGWDGGGIHCREFSDAVISGNIISGNTAEDTSWAGRGGGIYIYMADPFIDYNLINNNIATGIGGGYGGGIACGESDAQILNNTIYGNSCPDGDFGTGTGGGIVVILSNPIITNNIVRQNDAYQYSEIYVESSSSPQITYCDILGGWEGVGNIDADPLFCDLENSDFRLAENSPCVGAGQDGADIGAFGVGCEATGFDDNHFVPVKISLMQNYPNPFNSSTTIEYELAYRSRITIDIYDILGHKVTTLINQHQQAGYHQLVWHAEDLSSGMYFYKLQAGDYSETRKMMLLK